MSHAVPDDRVLVASAVDASERMAYSPKQVAEITGISRSRVYELLANGEISAVRVHGRILVRRHALEAWLAAQPDYEAP